MQSKSLSEIAEIIAGYTFRGALKNDPHGETQVISARNISNDGTVDQSELIRISLVLPRTNAGIARNDVLLSSRGIFRAGVLDQDTENIVAASSLFIIRIKDRNVIPEYLSIYLNSDQGQNSIQKVLTGSTIKTILRGALENLFIPIPSLDVQRTIVRISQNWTKREKLLSRKIDLGKSIAEGTVKYLLIP